MAYDPFVTVEALRDRIDAVQAVQIKGFYKEWADELEELAKYYDKKTTSSSTVTSRYLRELKHQVQTGGDLVAKQVQGLTKHNMFLIADEMVKKNVDWLAEFGFPKSGLNAVFSYVPTSVVNSLVTGQVYGKPGSWNLSSAIWSSTQKVQSTAYKIVAQGIAQQMPIADIAKSLAVYVDPSKKLLWQGPQGMKIYGKSVDYASQRLARTLVQHTYQQSFVALTKKNPFVIEYIWIANGSRVCPICSDRDGAHFTKETLPLDHPNGMCTMEPDIDPKMVDKLVDWVNSEDGTYPEIDEFAKSFGYVQSSKPKFTSNMPKLTLRDVKAQYGDLAVSKGLNTWFQKLPDDVKSEVKLMKKASGKTWDQFYQQDIFPGGQAAFDAKFGSKALSFDDAYKQYYSKLMEATKGGMYLGKMSKENFIKLLSTGDINKIGDVDDFVSSAFKQLGKKSGSSVSGVVKTKAEMLAEEKAAKEAAEKAAKEAKKKAAELAKVQAAAKEAAKKIGLDEFSASKWDKVLTSNRHLRSEFEEASDNFWKLLTDEQKSAFDRYTGSGYVNMNKYLRGLSEPYEGTEEACKVLKEALEHASLPETTVVRRGTSYNLLESLGVDDVASNKDKVVGAVVRDEGFLSTSPYISGGFNDRITYVIEVPKGSQATYVGMHSVHPSEDELLINCGGNYIIRDVEFRSNGKPSKIYMTLINLQSK